MLDTKLGALKLWQAFLFFLIVMLAYSLVSYMIANSPSRRSAKASLPPASSGTEEASTEEQPNV